MFFKAKDYVTAGNAVCGLASVVCVIHGQLYYAALLILVSWIFDALDGVVARLTNTFNKFGGEFDNMCDHLTYGIAPGFLVYGVYMPWMPGDGLQPIVLASLVAFVLPMTATIRHARLVVKPIKVPGFWIGLPRPVSAFVVVSYFTSSLFSELGDLGYGFGIVLTVGMGAANLGAWPYLSHHGHVWRPFVGQVLKLVVVSLSALLLAGPLAGLAGFDLIPPELFFDWFFFLLFGYSLFQQAGVPEEEWKKVRAAVEDWKQQPEA